MKKFKIRILLLLLIVILYGCSCGNSEIKISSMNPGVHVSTEYDMNYNYLGSLMTQVGETVLFVTPALKDQPSILMYYDRASDTCAPLCGRPECLHEDENCNAWLGADAAYTVQFYDGKLYMVLTGEAGRGLGIYEMKPDGTDRKLVRSIADSEFPHTNTYWYFHRGYLFVSGTYSSIKQGSQVWRVEIRAYALDQDEPYVSVYQHAVLPSHHENIFVCQYPENDHFYYMICSKPTQISSEGERKSSCSIWDFKTTDRSQYELFTVDLDLSYGEDSSYIAPKGVIRKDNNFIISDDGCLYTFSSEGELIELTRVEDDPEWDLRLLGDCIVLAGYPDLSWSRIRVMARDYEGHTLIDLIQTAANPGCTLDIWGIDGEFLYIMFTHAEGDNSRYVFGRYELNTGDYQELWNSDR